MGVMTSRSISRGAAPGYGALTEITGNATGGKTLRFIRKNPTSPSNPTSANGSVIATGFLKEKRVRNITATFSGAVRCDCACARSITARGSNIRLAEVTPSSRAPYARAMKSIAYLSLLMLLQTAAALAQMGPPIPLTASQFATSSTGQNVTLAVRVNGLVRGAVAAELLERVNDSLYRRTSKPVVLYLPAETPFVMGSMADVKPGAIIFVYAVTTTAAHADVKKVIVVTPYAKVE